ncbi:hypothetical protein EVAR_66070_1 [Eumeta japonica]|uniref:Uncharacterized protein n=1 Tax=Eumeta variegata TaxID=151549 RepID=A0A4C2A4J3_EUMVA|nr:hypothetical protein EVAR_66070_1 [Eumeta japonica]
MLFGFVTGVRSVSHESCARRMIAPMEIVMIFSEFIRKRRPSFKSTDVHSSVVLYFAAGPRRVRIVSPETPRRGALRGRSSLLQIGDDGAPDVLVEVNSRRTRGAVRIRIPKASAQRTAGAVTRAGHNRTTSAASAAWKERTLPTGQKP